MPSPYVFIISALWPELLGDVVEVRPSASSDASCDQASARPRLGVRRMTITQPPTPRAEWVNRPGVSERPEGA
jgi:hypothetical protein